MPFAANRWLLSALLSAVTLSGCEKVGPLGFTGDKEGANQFGFTGVQSINVTPDGRYILFWDHANGFADLSGVSYEIYMDKWDLTPEGITPGEAVSLNASPNSGEGRALGAKFAEMSEGEAPVSKGILVSSIKGVRSYTLEEKIQANLIYAFQVRVVSPDGQRDDNRRVLIYSAAENKIAFNGVKNIEVTPAGRLMLSWDPPQNLPKDVMLSDISYEIYMDSSSDMPADIIAGLPAANAAGSSLAPSMTTPSNIVEFPPMSLPAVNVAPLAEQRGGRFYEVSADLSPNLTYMFQVQARGPGGEPGDSAHVVLYRRTVLNFSGIMQERATLSSDTKTITLEWDPATGGTGNVEYLIYSDANFTSQSLLATTKDTRYVFQGVEPGRLYVFGVRARDGSAYDSNNRFVVITAPDPSDKVPPVFAGIKSAATVSDKKVLLKWDVSPSSDASLYNVYQAHNLNQAIASTADDYYMVTNLSPATSYAFVVRAVDTSGNEEKNKVQKSASTLPYSVPDFAGLDKVERLGGTDGLSKLKLSWLPAGGVVTGYKVYMATTAGGQNFSVATETLPDPNTTQLTVTGLDSGSTYFFVVRAYDSSSGSDRFELNTVEKSAATLEIKAPTFAGATSATPEPGSLGLSSVKVAWLAPQTDGIYDGFQVTYEAGTCAQAFTGAATTINVAGDAQRDYVVSGLTAATNYRFRVRAHYSITDITDNNTNCRTAKTEPPAPIFSGIGTIATAPGIQGFDSLNVTWPKATSSFSYYKIEWSTTSNFAVVLDDLEITDINMLSTTLSGLPTKTTLYVRITATFDEGGVLLKAGQSKVLSAKTEPPAPTGEGVSTVSVMAADALKVVWTAPTNGGAVFGGYKLWSYCGASAPGNLITKVAGGWATADETYAAGQLEATFGGLASNVQCCYQVRAYYDDSTNILTSNSTVAQKCATPTLTAPTFAGVTSVTNSNLATGFTQLTVNWNAVDPAQAGLFSYYEIDYATTSGGHTWASPIQVADRTQTSYTLSGLAENTTYFVRVRAVNNNGSPAVHNGSNAVQSAMTTPKTPTGDNLSTATSIGSTKALATYAPPNDDASVGGLYNNVFFFIQAGSTSDVTSYRTGVEAGGVISGEVTNVLSSGKVTLSGVPAVVRIPKSELSPGANGLEVWGLTPNQQVCIQAAAVYWVDGQPTRYLKSASSTTRCVTPTAGAPAFAGVASLTGFNNSQDFSQMEVNWGAITGDCTRVEISASLVQNNPNFASPWATATCGESSKTIAGLTPHKEYFVQVRAINEVSGVDYAAGQGVELSRTSRPTLPTGDTTSNAMATSIPKSLDEIAITYVEATAGIWNKTYIWKSTATSQVAAEAAVRAAALTKIDNSGPTSAPFVIKATGNTSHTDTSAVAGTYACYLVRSVYEDGSYYSSSANDVVKCARPDYAAPTFAGVSAAAVVGTWPDGTAKIELTFSGTPAGSIEEYWVYYSPSSSLGSFDLAADPWQKVDRGDTDHDANPNDNKILVGGKNLTPSGAGYYLVRYKFYHGPAGDVDNNTAVSSVATVAAAQANLILIPENVSGLAYSYYIMAYEASTMSGSFNAETLDATARSEDDSATCSYQFHENKNAWHSSCGVKNSTAKVKSASGATAVTATWAQAHAACRNSSGSGLLMRLPTQEEWTRAAKWVGTSYSDMWAVYSNGAGVNCAVAGTGNSTGARTSCKSSAGVFDVAGNLREWVDARMVRYDIGASSEGRFSYGPVIGRTQRNGIDNVSRRYHLIDPGADSLALALGADYAIPSPADTKQYGVDVQTWQSTTAASTGFRCVAFSVGSVPVMEKLAQPTEPVYTAADYGGAASTWTIPENLYAKDTRAESLTVTVNGNTGDNIAEGEVTISWKPWTKTICTPTCSTTDAAATYRIYRFVEPTKSSERLATPWALTGGLFNPYGADKPLDPLAVDGSGNALYTAVTADGRLVKEEAGCSVSTPGACTFTDSVSAGTDFSAGKIYNYIVVAIDSDGNSASGMTQRWRSPFFAGSPAVAGAASFRLEPRLRRASVFLVDESYQQAQTQPQIMVHVPMDKSGLDHDFFIHKYETASYNAVAPINNNPSGPPSSADLPLQAAAGGATWSPNAGKCQDLFLRTGSVSDVTACGNGSVVNTTTTTVQSKQGTNPLVSIDQGAFWKACRNTTFSDDAGHTYALSLASDAEWMKAADWGDLNHDGTIDIGPNVGLSVAALETGAADAVTVRCHTDNNPGSAYSANNSNTLNCRTRYGAADMVGNVWEWTTGQHYSAAGLDNGTDGLWFGQTLHTASNTILAIGGGGSAKYDLFRGFPKTSAGSVVAHNDDYYWYNTALRGAIRGGTWATAASAGRWALLVNFEPSFTTTYRGGRCRR